jgi:cobyrinic acid a,c-diamide synthase
VHRLVIAGVSSGVGKTTVVVALAAALRARGLRVVTFKCGPDYLDPTWHARASGRPSHNLDGWMMGREAVLSTVARASRESDIAIIEGVMGLYDGAAPGSDEGSAAEIARWLEAPVVVAVDAWAIARTLAAVGLGMRAFDPRVNVAGLFANRVGGRAHLHLLMEACRETVPVVGGLPRQDALAFPERHLGLHAATRDSNVEAWGALLEEWGGVDALLALARTAPPLPLPTGPRREGAASCRIGVARDDAFHFYYEDNLERLRAAGAELIEFSPLRGALPPVGGIYFGGGYPELHAAALAANVEMLKSIRAFRGPIYAECGGLMYLCRGIRTLDGKLHEMVGRVDAIAAMTPSLQALGYVEVETASETLLGPAGTRFRGHQYRHCKLESQPPAGAYRMRRFPAGEAQLEGFTDGNLLASWVHAHWASCPEAPEQLVRRCA